MTEVDVIHLVRLEYVGFGERFLGTDTTVRCSSILFNDVNYSLFSVFLYWQMLMAGATQ